MTSYTPEQYAAALAAFSSDQPFNTIGHHMDIIRQALQAMADPSWVLVPRETTHEMLSAASAAHLYKTSTLWFGNQGSGIYNAFIAAAPAYGEKI